MQTGTTLKKNLEYFETLTEEVALRSTMPKNEYRLLMEKLLGYSLDNKVISTAEHTACFNLSSTLSFCVPFAAVSAYNNLGLDLIIFPGSLIPINNSHYPRGILLRDALDRINFFSQQHLKDSPLLLAALPDSHIAEQLSKKGYEDFISTYCCNQPFDNYAFQLSRQMEKVYENIFVDSELPRLTVHPLEDIAAKMFVELLIGGDPFLEALLFNKENRENIFKQLIGVRCAWDENGYGSYLFWARIPGSFRLSKLSYDPEKNCLYDHFHTIPFDKDTLIENIVNGNLYIGVYLALTMVSYLPDIPVIGGPKQLKYLTSMINASNSLGVYQRSIRLSNLGYMDYVPEEMRNEIPSKGAAAYLLRNQLSVEEVINYLKNI